jgi:excisionase family DNA binding protein
MSLEEEIGPLLTPKEVADIFRVNPKTVVRWSNIGKLSCIRTLGGHRRFREDEVRHLLANPVKRRRRSGAKLLA